MTRPVPLSAAILCLASTSFGQTREIVTSYRYNADGALTAVSTSDRGETTTTYLTWDDFLPDVADPTQGTVQTGNGRLIGYGDAPGIGNATTTFQFDVRDRLVGYQDSGRAETYDYYANGMLASSATGSDALHFYYDNSTNQRVMSIHEAGLDLWSGYLDNVRYISDGTEDIRLFPRKDAAACYDASQMSLTPHAYDAYGSQPDASLDASYDLHNNPFQYGGEYRDPLWGGIYLRARWYHPDLPIFLTRDSAGEINRYGYGGGNPVMNVDPSGKTFLHSFGSFFTGVSKVASKVNNALNKGWWGHLDRFFLAPLMSPLQIIVDPQGFWEAIRYNRDGTDFFLAAGVASSFLWEVAAEEYPLATTRVFTGQIATHATLDVAENVTAAAHRGFKHFNWNTLTDGLELAFGGIFDDNLVAGQHYNHFNFTGRDVADAMRVLDDYKSDTAVIFRRAVPKGVDGELMPVQTGPLQEWMHLGNYHEQLFAVTKDRIYFADIENGVVRAAGMRSNPEVVERMFGANLDKKAFRVVGVKEKFNTEYGFQYMNPLRLGTANSPTASVFHPSTWKYFGNQSQLHSAAVLQALGMR